MGDARRDHLIRLCQELIRLPSPSGKEGDVAGFLRSIMTPLGFYVDVDIYGNITGSINFGGDGPTLLLESQMDQADPGDFGKWSCYPFCGTLERDRIYGRGATDQKGILAAMILAASWLKNDCSSSLSGKLVVAATVHQETFESSASRQVADRVRPDMVISGEASSLSVERGQRGRAVLVLETSGRMAHSSLPGAGTNSAEQMVELIHRIRSSYRPVRDPFFGEGPMVLTNLVSLPLDNNAALPSMCCATFDLRLLPGETRKSVQSDLERSIDEAGRDIGDLNLACYIDRGDGLCYTGAFIEADRFAPAWELSKDHPFINKVLSGIASAGISPSLSERAGFGSNGCVYGGELGIPTIVFGPSRRELAHIVDEYIEVEQLVLGCMGYYGIAREILTPEEEICRG